MALTLPPLPRVTIAFCIQCKWNLRAAYFAQELLSTFGTALGEVALQPSTGGTFVVEMFYAPPESSSNSDSDPVEIQRHVLWDRKAEGGFPETKELKRRVRDIIDPGRDLGHVDGKKKSVADQPIEKEGQNTQENALPRPKAIGYLQGQEAERKFTPMDVDVDSAATKEEGHEDNQEVRAQATGDLKRNPDGTICEDCN